MLESIFPDELEGESAGCPEKTTWLTADLPPTVISDDQLAIRVEPDVQNEREPCEQPGRPLLRL